MAKTDQRNVEAIVHHLKHIIAVIKYISLPFSPHKRRRERAKTELAFSRTFHKYGYTTHSKATHKHSAYIKYFPFYTSSFFSVKRFYKKRLRIPANTTKNGKGKLCTYTTFASIDVCMRVCTMCVNINFSRRQIPN